MPILLPSMLVIGLLADGVAADAAKIPAPAVQASAAPATTAPAVALPAQGRPQAQAQQVPAPPEAQAQRIPMTTRAVHEAKSDTPIPGKPVRYVRVPTSSVRIDKKRPYMRIYYWPPLPERGYEAASSGAGTAGSGQGSMAPLDYGMNLDPVYFPFNTSDMVAPSSHLQRIASWVRSNPSNHLTLTGHADPRGAKARNERLSVERAQIVKDALVGLGAPPSQITLEGMGARKPVMKGKSQEAHHWGSRRVEFHLHRPVEKPSQTAQPKATTAASGLDSSLASVTAEPKAGTPEEPKG